jgi:hypothetical protein
MSKEKKGCGCSKQKGGSQYRQLFYAQTAVGGPAAISAATLSVIDQTPMFNPLQTDTVIPGPTGIIPTGLYLAGTASVKKQEPKEQSGGWFGWWS